MKKTRPNLLKLYGAPALLLLVGLAIIVLGLVYPIPEADRMKEVHGPLLSYYFKQEGRRRGDYTTILVLEDSSRIWTNLITRENAATFLPRKGLEIRTYIDPVSIAVPIDGALKSFGLWVDGEEILSLENALREERAILRGALPTLGVIMAIIAFVLHRKEKNKEEEDE